MSERVSFYNKNTGEKMWEYGLEDSFAGELRSTIELLAYENNIKEDDISLKFEKRNSEFKNPQDWLTRVINDWSKAELKEAIDEISKHVDPEVIQGLYQDQMEEDGYFK